MTTHVLYNCYQEVNNLPRSIQSVRDHFDDVTFVFVDGKYPDYPGEGPNFSDDGTHEIAVEHGALVDVAGYECEKRTAGLNHIDTFAKDGDYVLVMDADEVITARWAWPTKVGTFTFSRDSRPEVTYGRNRLFRWEPGLHFKGRHYDLYSASGELFATLEAGPNEAVGEGIHYNTSHTPERVVHKRDYYRHLRERELSPWLQHTH